MQHSDKRVTPLTLDVTNAAQIRGAVDEVESLDILINNAGVSSFDDLSDRHVLEHQLAVIRHAQDLKQKPNDTSTALSGLKSGKN